MFLFELVLRAMDVYIFDRDCHPAAPCTSSAPGRSIKSQTQQFHCSSITRGTGHELQQSALRGARLGATGAQTKWGIVGPATFVGLCGVGCGGGGGGLSICGLFSSRLKVS